MHRYKKGQNAEVGKKSTRLISIIMKLKLDTRYFKSDVTACDAYDVPHPIRQKAYRRPKIVLLILLWGKTPIEDLRLCY